jgi:putative transcriptional regulator
MRSSQLAANTRFGRLAALALAVLCAGAGLGAVDPAAPSPDKPAADAAPADPPPGTLLIASAQVQDPRFYHAVILILRHNRDGAFGIVVNLAAGSRKIAELLAAAGEADDSAEGEIAVRRGGPVQPQLGFVVHSADYRRAGTRPIDGKVAMTASKEALKDIGHHHGPRQYWLALGYAGWGAGQLEGEIAHKDWFTVLEDPSLVFGDDLSTVWERALARRQQEL